MVLQQKMASIMSYKNHKIKSYNYVIIIQIIFILIFYLKQEHACMHAYIQKCLEKAYSVSKCKLANNKTTCAIVIIECLLMKETQHCS